MSQRKPKSYIINTTIGEFVEAVYEAAFEEYKNEDIAHRIALQTLLKRLRQERAPLENTQNQSKKTILRSEFNRLKKKA